MGEIHELFVLALFLVWFAGATPEYRSAQIDYRQRPFLGAANSQLQIQNRAARRISCHYRDRSVGIPAENRSLQIQILT